MWIYVKKQEKLVRWKAIEASKRAQVELDPDTGFTTVLSVSENVPSTSEGGSVSENATYAGPFYIDIDSEDIEQSIDALKKVLRAMTKSGLPRSSIRCWVSGKKGFHVLVPAAAFSDETPHRKLPLVYWHMASKLNLLNIPCVDKSVYSCGRGRMWRVEGKKRIDNGMFKVELSEEETANMTSVLYNSVCRAAREREPEPKVELCQVWEMLFKDALARAAKSSLPKPVFVDKTLTDALAGQLPHCLEQLQFGENIADVPYNDVSLQFAKGMAAFGGTDAPELIDQFADRYPLKTSYNTPERRRGHCMGAYQIARNNTSYDWSCAAARRVLQSSPCEGCPVANTVVDEPTDAPAEAPDAEPENVEGASEPDTAPPEDTPPIPLADLRIMKAIPQNIEGNSEGLMFNDSGYGFMSDSRMRRICNFLFDFDRQYIEFIPNQERDVRVAVAGRVMIEGKSVGRITMEESYWTKSNLIASLSGLGNASFFGSDGDVQKLRAVLTNKIENRVPSIRRVSSFGIHRQMIAGKPIYSYVEPGWSIDQDGNEDLCVYTGKPLVYPTLKTIPGIGLESRDEISRILKLILAMNEPKRIGLALGWFMANFLQEHILAKMPEWPLLSLHGEPGSGKTSTAAVLGWLHGVDYRRGGSPLNLPNATPYVVWAMIASTTTVPRIMEEYNRSKMLKNYDGFGENFKMAWNKHSATRGTIRTDRAHGVNEIGANSVQIPLTGPIVICSEQEITMPALVERTMQIRFTKQAMLDPAHERAFVQLEDSFEPLRPFAKTCYAEALAMTEEDAWELLRKQRSRVPASLMGRPRHCYEVCFMGLDFLRYVVERNQLDCLTELDDMIEAVETWVNANSRGISRAKAVSEVDNIFKKMSVMAAMSVPGQRSFLDKNIHYRRVGAVLWLDASIAHAMYMHYVSNIERMPPVIVNFGEFMELLQGEEYFIEEFQDPSFANNRNAVRLDMLKMVEKRIDVAGFRE